MEDNNGLKLTTEASSLCSPCSPEFKICARVTDFGRQVKLSWCSCGSNNETTCGSSPFARFVLDGSGITAVNGELRANEANLEMYWDMDSQELVFYAASEQIQLNIEYLPVNDNRAQPEPNALFCFNFPLPVDPSTYDDEYREHLRAEVMSSPVLGPPLVFED